MSEVSGKMLAHVREVAVRRGVALETLVAGTGFTVDDLSKGTARISWESFADLFDKLEILVGGPKAMEETGRESVEVGIFFTPLASVVGLLATPPLLYQLTIEYLGAKTFSCLRLEHTELPDGR